MWGLRRHFCVFLGNVLVKTSNYREGGLITNDIKSIQYREMKIENLLIGKEPYEGQACLYLFCFSEEILLTKTIGYLHPKEWEYYRSLKFESRIKSYLAGRYAAKRAVSIFSKEVDLNRIWIDRGVLNQPVVVHSSHVQVSITHCEDLAAAVAFPEKLPLGIDIEKIRLDKLDVLESQVTPKEFGLIRTLPYPYETMLTVFWTVKEAISKVLKTGLSAPFSIFELRQIENKNDIFISTYENFYQYETVSFLFNLFVCSITYPKGTLLNLDAIKKGLKVPIRI